MANTSTKKNRLAQESSPYLKQHEDNPVDWYPWGVEALERAKALNRPIFLSIGYSACHWCHVMAHESFESEAVADALNAEFVSIKVDREERPDLDQIYQTVPQLMRQGGGWPLSVFLTPDLKPFYGGTYFPPQDAHGRPGFLRVVQGLAKLYREDPDQIQSQSQKFTDVIQAQGGKRWVHGANLAESEKALPQILQDSVKKLLSVIDWQNGGVGSAPKFPNTTALTALYRLSQLEGVDHQERQSAREGVLLALNRMRRGGIFDQIGGGFHRYSVDSSWSVPHFEKMLYDNALLLKLYSEVLLNEPELESHQRDLFLDTLKMTIDYVAREMTDPTGAFYAAQDADSEGEEGKFFAWSCEEVRNLFSKAETEILIHHFGMTETGNFEHGKNVLFLPEEITRAAEHAVIQGLMERLRNEREKRIKPALDNKVLTAWNGLMVSGLAWASLALEKHQEGAYAKKARDLATRAFDSVSQSAYITSDGGKNLSATIQAGQPKHLAYLDDYAFLAMAALDLARVEDGYVSKRFEFATKLAQEILDRFYDSENGGFYFTDRNSESLIHRPKSFFDQAIPAGASVAYQVLMVIANEASSGASANAAIQSPFEADLKQFQSVLEADAFGLSELLNASLLYQFQPITIKGQTRLERRAHPMAFVVGTVQEDAKPIFCHRQTCSESWPV